jgi:hypothetical protein
VRGVGGATRGIFRISSSSSISSSSVAVPLPFTPFAFKADVARLGSAFALPFPLVVALSVLVFFAWGFCTVDRASSSWSSSSLISSSSSSISTVCTRAFGGGPDFFCAGLVFGAGFIDEGPGFEVVCLGRGFGFLDGNASSVRMIAYQPAAHIIDSVQALAAHRIRLRRRT